MTMRSNFTFLIADSVSPEFLESEYYFFMVGTGRMTKVEFFEVDKKMIKKVFHDQKYQKDNRKIRTM